MHGHGNGTHLRHLWFSQVLRALVGLRRLGRAVWQYVAPPSKRTDRPEKTFAELKAERQAAAEIESAHQKAAAEEAAAPDTCEPRTLSLLIG